MNHLNCVIQDSVCKVTYGSRRTEGDIYFIVFVIYYKSDTTLCYLWSLIIVTYKTDSLDPGRWNIVEISFDNQITADSLNSENQSRNTVSHNCDLAPPLGLSKHSWPAQGSCDVRDSFDVIHWVQTCWPLICFLSVLPVELSSAPLLIQNTVQRVYTRWS